MFMSVLMARSRCQQLQGRFQRRSNNLRFHQTLNHLSVLGFRLTELPARCPASKPRNSASLLLRSPRPSVPQWPPNGPPKMPCSILFLLWQPQGCCGLSCCCPGFGAASPWKSEHHLSNQRAKDQSWASSLSPLMSVTCGTGDHAGAVPQEQPLA